ncbi:equilibrative nucleobase transporter 1-like [Mercenaria mercenaria]|uniref:equilibrative nucleobase transporter 1-like n=1 Tax=Mercenaria mercenaria TaxID=6596 RepID=UPI00234F9923|nr:equilibrative nucleobase transporter 1-like [Mercenaria mercenaria]
MELYRKYPVLITIWALMENLLFAGVVFGWGSLVLILKEEGFYSDYCKQSDIFNKINSTLPDTNSVLSVSNNSLDNETMSSQSFRPNKASGDGCPEQESKLNLWYSIAASALYLIYAGSSHLQRRFGTRITRVIFQIIYLIGTLCMAFASPELPWLLLPGLSGMGMSGMVIACTNTQVAYLHPRVQSTIVSLFVGLFDFSSVNKQLIRIAYENGISRQTSYIFMSVVFVVITTISTMLFLPKMFIGDDYLKEMEIKLKQKKLQLKQADTDKTKTEQTENQDELPKSLQQELAENGSSLDLEVAKDKPKPSLCSIIFSVTCVFHLYWTFIHAVRFITFIGQLNVWLESIFHKDETKVGDMLSTFSYMTMGTIFSALFCGFVYDYHRKRYINAGKIKSVYLPAVLSVSLVIFYSICVTVFCFIKNDVTPYFAFVFFTFFRTSLYSVGVAFMGYAFPADYFNNLMGMVLFAGGIGGLFQYPLFQWYEAYEGSYTHVNSLLLVLQVSTIIHPVLLYIKGYRDRDTTYRNVYTQESHYPRDEHL